ncbi:MFS transporter [Parvibaculum sedimenti]|uniref:MFS transporter n=1 Tax=Parvibaculum sedimenti TaxID=2608632 RepID=A0A6N6VIB3_9HYPH|nr:major facilitator superfamily domain-containing protein 6 [Parvibaculum sedimenti]KAB7739015.1 MFS transporter [Parvibaculum sedimenti]
MPLALRLSVFYASLCLFSGVQVPFFPVWLKAKGLGPQEISIIMAATMFLRIAAGPLFAFLADRLDNRRRVVIALAWGSLIAVCLYTVSNGFWQIFLVTLLLMSLWPSITPLIEALAMKAAHDHGIDYGRVRLWCSITFIGASLGVGWLLGWQSPLVISTCLILAIMVNLAGAYLLAPEVPTRMRSTRNGGQLRAALAIAREPLFLIGLVTASLIQSTHAVYYAFGTLNWQKLGYSNEVIGILWGVGVVAEIILFAFSGKVVARVGAVRMMSLGAAASVLRWGVTAMSPPLWVLFPLQTLHAFTYCAAHLGTIHFLARATPRSLAATAQSLYASLSAGVMMGAMTLAAGSLYQSFGPRAYLLSAAVGAVSFFGTLIIGARWSGGPLLVLEEEGSNDDDRDPAHGRGAGC